MSLKVVLRGNRDLTMPAIPESWIGRNAILHSDVYNITETDLDKIKKRLTQDSYWSKNPERRRQLFFNFEDNFQEVDWVMVGTRRGKTGEFWNTDKLDLLQQEKQDNIFVPDSYISMKDVKKYFGTRATKEQVERAGFEVKYGKKKGKQGRLGHFVEPEILEDKRTLGVFDGAVPAREVFSQFPRVGKENMAEIVEKNKEDLMKKRIRSGWMVTRKDVMVSQKELEDISRGGASATKKLRSREVTTVDVVGATAELRKEIFKNNS